MRSWFLSFFQALENGQFGNTSIWIAVEATVKRRRLSSAKFNHSDSHSQERRDILLADRNSVAGRGLPRTRANSIFFYYCHRKSPVGRPGALRVVKLECSRYHHVKCLELRASHLEVLGHFRISCERDGTSVTLPVTAYRGVPISGGCDVIPSGLGICFSKPSLLSSCRGTNLYFRQLMFFSCRQPRCTETSLMYLSGS